MFCNLYLVSVKNTINRPLSVYTHHLDIKEFTTLYDNILVTITAIFTSIQNARENIFLEFLLIFFISLIL